MSGQTVRASGGWTGRWRGRCATCAGACAGTWLAVAAAARPPEAMVSIRYGVIDPPVVAQRDITIRYETSIHPLDPEDKPLEVSSVAWAGDRLLLTSDRHSHVVFTASVDLTGGSVALGLPEPHPVVLGAKHLLNDLEALAVRPVNPGAGGGVMRGYAFGSLSNEGTGQRTEPRQHLARFQIGGDGAIDPGRTTVLTGDGIRDALSVHFAALGVAEYESFNVDYGRNTPRWGNVEAVAWSPDHSVLLCGLRDPLAGADALLFALAGVDEAFDREDAGALRVTDLFRLPLGGRGVSDLTWDPVTSGYLITAAMSNGPKLDDGATYPMEDVHGALFWWSGNKADAPRRVADFMDLSVDGVCRIGDSPFVVVASDEGDVSEERRGRQSVLTAIYFLGWPAGGTP